MTGNAEGIRKGVEVGLVIDSASLTVVGWRINGKNAIQPSIQQLGCSGPLSTSSSAAWPELTPKDYLEQYPLDKPSAVAIAHALRDRQPKRKR